MFPRVAAAAMIIAALSAGTAWSACPPGQSKNCLDLDAVPQISQRIIAGEKLSAAPKTPPAADAPTPYTGPTVGLSRTVRQVPTVGYHWSTN